MDLLKFVIKKLIGGIPLILGVTFISFLLMVYFGPDLTYDLIGKNSSQSEIKQIQDSLGYNHPFLVRYTMYLDELLSLDFGYSMVKDQKVSYILAQAIPVSLQLTLPGFILGNLLAIILAFWASSHRGCFIDKAIMTASVIGMSISFLIVIISFQIFFSSRYGLNLFPVRGWKIYDYNSNFSLMLYLKFVTVPTLATVFVTLGYNTRFYRAVLVEEFNKDYVRTVKSFGFNPGVIMGKFILKNTMVPIITRIMFSIPLVIISGSLLIESYFGIPGVGQVTYDAIIAGDQPILKAVVGLTAILFVFVLIISEISTKFVDPRINTK